MRVLFLLYGLVGYLLFFAAILYGIGFVGDLAWVPKGIDDGVQVPLPSAIVVNVLLLLLFAVQHNVMARPWFKVWWTRFVPRPIERSTFVALASLILLLLYWQWRPMPATVWHVDNALGRGVLWALYCPTLGSKNPRLQAITSSKLWGWNTTVAPPIRVSISSYILCGLRSTANRC
jgi:hypothetical protein